MGRKLGREDRTHRESYVLMSELSKKAAKKGRDAVAARSSALERLVVEYVAIDEIKPNSYNPNRQDAKDFELLCRSIREDGFTQPVIVHRDTREIVDGEHRWRAARELGMDEVPIVYVDMSEEQMRVATLRHNRARGSEDVDLGAQLLRDLRELGALDWAKSSLLLSDDDVERLVSDVPVAEQLASADYGEAWTPTRAVDTDKADATTSSTMTDDARAKATEFKQELAAAETDQERIVIEKRYRKENVRVQVSFTAEEAAVVRKVLEPKPAQKLLELCMRADETPA